MLKGGGSKRPKLRLGCSDREEEFRVVPNDPQILYLAL
jgi:hypothetical protein